MTGVSLALSEISLMCVCAHVSAHLCVVVLMYKYMCAFA